MLVPTITGLAAGTYFALAPPQLKALRACKGDRARRDYLRDHGASLEPLDVGDAWWFIRFLGCECARGKSLHRGQMHRIEWLDAIALSSALADLAGRDLRARFFAIDEAKFRYSNVAFWVADGWKRDGRTTVLDDEVFAGVERGVAELSAWLARVAAGREVVFSTSY